MSKDFIVRHSKSRIRNPKAEYTDIFYNFIFTALDDELRTWCFENCRNWKKIHFTLDIKQVQDYREGLEIIFNENKKSKYPVRFVNHTGLSYEDVFSEGYVEVLNPILTHIKKFDLFQFRGYFTNTDATKGIIQTITDLSNGLNPTFTSNGYLLQSCLESLYLHWD